MLQPILLIVCLITAWTFTLLLVWSIWQTVRSAIATTQRLHQIPCPHCRFFTDSHFLKCAVHPDTALSEAAVDCLDFH